MPEDVKTITKPKKSYFTKEEIKYIMVVLVYILLMSAVPKLELIGTACVIFAILAGLGIKEHGLKLFEIREVK
jgi:hypothetical protein